jgi:membrane protease YdiL (CAAX protease family)
MSQGSPTLEVQAFELGVLFLLLGPSMAFSLLASRPVQLTFSMAVGVIISQNLALMGLVSYFLWRNHESLASIGLTSKNALREIGLGLILFIPLSLVLRGIEMGLKALGLSTPEAPPSFLTPSNTAQMLQILVLLIVIVVVEEVIFRGYIIKRLRALTNSTVAAVLLSAVIFAFGHGYQGTGAIFAVGMLGLVFALIYVWRKSLLAPMVLHFMQNFIGLILLPLSGSAI